MSMTAQLAPKSLFSSSPPPSPSPPPPPPPPITTTVPRSVMSLHSILPNLCPRCHLRLLNVRTPSAYSKISPLPETLPCPVCLGVLQEPALRTLISLLRPHLSPLVHNFRFKINAALPVSASVIRDRAARHHIATVSNCPPTTSAAPPDVSLREAVKWAVCARIQDALGLRYHPDAQLFLDVVFSHPASASDAAFTRNHSAPAQKKPRLPAHVSTAAVARAVDRMSDTQFSQALGPAFFPPPPVQEPVQVAVTVSVAPVLFAGSYNKLSRVVSQTPWFVDSPSGPRGLAAVLQHHDRRETDQHGRRKRTELSVEDVAAAGIKHVLRPEKATFTAGGREDVDVRMLGKGRPFVVEVTNPNIVPALITDDMVREMADISRAKTASVVLHNFRVVSKDYFAKMRSFESDKRKCYRCVVWTSREVPSDELEAKLHVDGGFLLKQKTPLRVLHRRTQAVRERQIFEACVVRVVSPNFFVLDVVAAAGTYIKEFVHGDSGRTLPNVAQLLNCDADIIQLDVTDIHTETSGT